MSGTFGFSRGSRTRRLSKERDRRAFEHCALGDPCPAPAKTTQLTLQLLDSLPDHGTLLRHLAPDPLSHPA